MKPSRLFPLMLVLTLLASLTGGAGGAPLAGPCLPGAAYDPACDADRDGDVDIFDIQLTAGHWNQSGTYVGDNNHNHLGQTWTGSNNPLKLTGSYGAPEWAPLVLSNSMGDGMRVESAGGDGMYLNSAGFNGVTISAAGGDGVEVYAAGDDGVHIYHAGSPGTQIASAAHDGFEIEGAQGNGLFVGYAGWDGMQVNSAAADGVSVDSAGHDGVHVGSAGNAGVSVGWAGGDGMDVSSATYDGVFVSYAGYDGVRVYSAGDDGVEVYQASDNGVYANTTQTNHEWGFNTPDKIYAGTALASNGPLLLVAQSGDSNRLETGDLVVVSGTGTTLGESESPLPLVRRTSPGDDSVMGVVYRRFVAEEKIEETTRDGQVERQTRLDTRSAKGPVAPGDMLLVVVLGPAQVKVDGAAPIAAGQPLTVATDGRARPLDTIKVRLAGDAGTADLPEGAPVIGVAMGAVQDGLVWVLVNPQ